MMDQELNSQFLIEDSKYEIVKGPSKNLPMLPSTITDLPPMLHSIREQSFLLNTDISGLQMNLKNTGHMLIMFVHIIRISQ